ncbi:hypothetical protein [Streptomyces sp. 1331.2]|uniref:hypothetical protein n=1 Tax=Streptomyces sp. 1331.2 TaxID=1938835 RepID=UPI000BD4B871|nr:hypothetical protein [Streptomyces sp. 1331.2]SOB88776.1 hypothetical protein SAMN06272789_7083 [Streptomyces sp. 1331.2]
MTTSRGTLDGDRSDAGTLLPPGGQRRRLYLAGLPRPVARAREFTGQTLADWSWAAPASGVDPDVVDDVLLLVAELIANAMMHADGPLELVLQAFGARLRIEVSDATTALPVPAARTTRGFPVVMGCSSSSALPTAGAPSGTARARPSGPRLTSTAWPRAAEHAARWQSPRKAPSKDSNRQKSRPVA